MTTDPGVADGIAVIGMAGRFPGAPNLEVFWENLKNGVESITHFSEQDLAGIPASIRNNSPYVRARSLVDGVDLFDADFFAMNPREAEYTDPQHRLLLETAWEALENAGYDSERFTGSIGAFAGCSLNSYLLHNLSSNPEFLGEFLSSQQMGAHPALLGNDKDFLVTRLAYKLNLRGPSLSVQTACSTSLVAICQACQNLLTFQCDLALAGGVSLTFPQRRGYVYEEGSIVSRDGRCRPFDAAADGTVFGDGVGLVVLKRADEALRDGDQIQAIIRGFAVNNDGSNKVSYMAPSVEGQAEVIAAAQALAGIDIETIRYIEAHGTGTALGDPIEIAALTQAFRAGTDKTQFCALGALKGNVGHLEVASGVAGLIKAVLAVKHGEIPPTLNFTQANPRIDFKQTPFYISSELQSWPESSAPRRAGVSSFGVGGTNAHVVLEQAPDLIPEPENPAPQLLVLSAKTPAALEAATQRLADHLKIHPQDSLRDVAFTLQMGRRAFRHRRAVVAASSSQALQLLTPRQKQHTHDAQGRKTGVAFLFPGQGSQHEGMGRDLYEHDPIYRAEADRCFEILKPKLDVDLRTLLYPQTTVPPAKGNLLAQTAIAQPALFVVEYALAQTWLARGVHPQVLLGHSLGEYVAAVLAKIFTLEDALHLLAVRGRLMQSLAPGSMWAVSLPEKDVRPLLDENIALAAVNGPRSCVLSGPRDAMAALSRQFAGQRIACRELGTSHAFHSAMMDPILARFEEEVRRVPRLPPQIPLVSSLYGRTAQASEWVEPAYWSAQLRQTVRFADALAALSSDINLAFLEVGPGQTLTALARQSLGHSGQVTVYSDARSDEESGREALLSATGQLWTAGVEINWAGLHPSGKPRRVALPTYPFERKRFWIEPTRSSLVPTNPDLSEHTLPPVVAPEKATQMAAHDCPISASDLELLIAEQLRIMDQQLAILKEAPALSLSHAGRNGQ